MQVPCISTSRVGVSVIGSRNTVPTRSYILGPSPHQKLEVAAGPLGTPPKGERRGKRKSKKEKEFDDSHWKPEAGLYQVKDEEKNLITVILSGM